MGIGYNRKGLSSPTSRREWCVWVFTGAPFPFAFDPFKWRPATEKDRFLAWIRIVITITTSKPKDVIIHSTFVNQSNIKMGNDSMAFHRSQTLKFKINTSSAFDTFYLKRNFSQLKYKESRKSLIISLHFLKDWLWTIEILRAFCQISHSIDWIMKKKKFSSIEKCWWLSRRRDHPTGLRSIGRMFSVQSVPFCSD